MYSSFGLMNYKQSVNYFDVYTVEGVPSGGMQIAPFGPGSLEQFIDWIAS